MENHSGDRPLFAIAKSWKGLQGELGEGWEPHLKPAPCVAWSGHGNSLKEPASNAYEQVFSPHHGWTIRKAVGAGMFMLPTKVQFLKKLHEEEDSAWEYIQQFVKFAGSVVQYVNNIYVDKEIGTDW